MNGGDSGAVAPSEAGSAQFTIQVRASTDDDFDGIAVQPKAVKVRVQASGAGFATVSATDVDGDDTLYAGDMDREIMIAYTAVGEIKDGTIKLTIPAEWSAPMGDYVTVEPAAAVGGVRASGDYTADQLTDLAADADDDVDLVALTIIVDGVAMAKGDTLTITYANAMVQPTKADGVNFKVEIDGGDGPDTGPKEVTGDGDITHETTVDVEAARAGSGDGMVAYDPIKTGDTVETITFTYIPDGEIFPRTEFRVTVHDEWSAPVKETAEGTAGAYTVTLMRHDEDEGEEVPIDDVIEKRNPGGYDMIARVTADSVLKDDKIIFEYQNAVAPGTVGSYEFVMSMDGEPLASGSPSIIVQGSDATQLMVEASGRLSVDTTDPISITVTIQDDETPSNTAVRTEDTTVELSSDSGTGEFSMTADGEYEDTLEVTILMGMPSVMVYYSDSETGTATITAESADLDPGDTMVEVYTDVVTVGTVTFALADSDGAAKAGTIATTDDVVTVTATGATAEKMAAFSIGTAVTGGGSDMEESADTPGTYTGSWTVIADLHDGSHTVTVTIDGESDDAEDQLTIDTTAPTVTASASPAMVADGDTVTISAVVTGDATSVTANVSMLDDQATASVELTDADADGTYTGTHDISAENGADNGMHTITVTATDAAGNSGDGSAAVELRNDLSFTSMIPSGISLFHVPLDDPSFNTIGDLRAAIGADKVNFLAAYDAAGRLEPSSNSIPIAGGRGIIVHLSSAATVTFTGEPWGGGTAVITLEAGDSNLIGLPLDIEGVDKISDIIGLDAAIEGVYPNLTDFVAAAGDTGDGDVTGDAAYYVVASAAATITVAGEGWSDSTEMVGAAPIALSGYKVDNQTPVLSVFGSVVDEITGVAKEGFRVKVKNLSTKGVVSEITSIETADGYSMTLLDLANAYAARVGDVLEISADSPNPLIGVKPVRHIVTVDDVKNSTIQLEELIAYEIPAETELLRNYPNPFNPETWIPYRLAEDANVSLTIYDTSGALVRSIDIGHQTAAVYETRAKAIYWDGRNRFGEQVASGLYFYHLSAGDFSGTRRMVILK